ncbi:hypothetical protein [Corynebacterium cystitidis]|uniref:Uncharacterized protein n=1 Tax=Corynebacterium cystitidis DSM 20524 TaxID=1121357 RepID=A0A1H9WMY3_9CORY|nr:hypothetical protein [Corynebacterium cystitidis]WJY82838.1 hypothetical protein CCYS_09620 [Corynebacterium cystitidis DSM 20524]SES35047.1 hypothetical protein SAMN05661109_02813 [Corynebacterium cystitidis DSM 20524]SNV69962.1 Uncharacterised protein [Corynebacterium cystitidis]
MSEMQSSKRGRRRRTPLKELYPGFPYVNESVMDPEAIKAQRFAINLGETIKEFIERGECSSLRDFSRKVGIAHNMLISYMDGSVWIDGHTLAKLETMTGRPLWDPRTVRRKLPPQNEPDG